MRIQADTSLWTGQKPNARESLANMCAEWASFIGAVQDRCFVYSVEWNAQCLLKKIENIFLFMQRFCFITLRIYCFCVCAFMIILYEKITVTNSSALSPISLFISLIVIKFDKLNFLFT